MTQEASSDAAGRTGAMSAPDPPPPPHGGEGGGPAGKESLQQASASASEAQPVIDVFGNDMAPAVFTLALLMLNLLSGRPSLSFVVTTFAVLMVCSLPQRFMVASSESSLATSQK